MKDLKFGAKRNEDKAKQGRCQHGTCPNKAIKRGGGRCYGHQDHRPDVVWSVSNRGGW